MIHVVIYQNEKEECTGFQTEGHAEYADPGQDIVCAAASILVINTINAIEEFTEDAFTCDCKDGMIESWEFTSDVSAGTDLLMDALMLGLRNIVKSYGTDYLQVADTEEK